MIFKRERSYAVIQFGDFVALDGLNGNVDVFKADDFTLIATLDTNESSMISGIFIEDKLYIGSSNKRLYVYDTKQDFRLLYMIDTQNNVNCFLLLPESNYLLCGERWARVEVFDISNKGSMDLVHT
jgi:outer membrane protein assembly factor BamB